MFFFRVTGKFRYSDVYIHSQVTTLTVDFVINNEQKEKIQQRMLWRTCAQGELINTALPSKLLYHYFSAVVICCATIQ